MQHLVPSGTVGVEIITSLHRPLPEHVHAGQVHVEAPSGGEYLVRLANKTAHRVLAVLTVDGLSAMDGKPGGKASGGYVLRGYEEVEIPGWRLDDQKVARFKFGAAGDSYAAQTGRPRDVGVVGCCFWAEDSPVAVITRGAGRSLGFGDDYKGDKGVEEKTSGGILLPEASKQAVGTEFGREDHHAVVRVAFRRGRELATLELRYNDRENLIKAGVIKESAAPSAFPADRPRGCEPPEGWKG